MCSSRPMRIPLVQRLILAVTFFALIGGDRGAIQCVAWGKILWERSAERPFFQALASTFSGEEPCEICDALRESHRTGKDSPAPPPTVKLDLATVAGHSFVPAPRPLLATYPEQGDPFRADLTAPPTPPPPQVAS